MGLDLSKNTPMPLFLWLVAANLFSARISADQALRAAKALKDAGLTTADHMAEATWKERVLILNRNGYARFDEKTSRFLQEVADHCLEAYGGDLRKLREKAGRDPARERELLKEFKGIGDVGADIFFREVQVAWDELYPFADKRALQAAETLGLGKDAEALASSSRRTSCRRCSRRCCGPISTVLWTRSPRVEPPPGSHTCWAPLMCSSAPLT